MKKVIFPKILILSLLLLLVNSITLSADNQRVFDYADLLTDEDETYLEERIVDFIELTNQDMVVLTVTDAEGKTPQEVADDFYDYNGFGIGENKDGVLLLIDMDNRQPHITTTGLAIDILNDSKLNYILDQQYPYIVDGDYLYAFLEPIEIIEQDMLMGVQDGAYREDVETGEKTYYYDEDNYSSSPAIKAGDIALAIIGGLLISFITSLLIKKSYNKEFRPVPYDYRSNGNLNLTKQKDILINTFVTTRHKPKDPPPSSGGGGSSVHTSSSGSSHGGSTGRSF